MFIFEAQHLNTNLQPENVLPVNLAVLKYVYGEIRWQYEAISDTVYGHDTHAEMRTASMNNIKATLVNKHIYTYNRKRKHRIFIRTMWTGQGNSDNKTCQEIYIGPWKVCCVGCYTFARVVLFILCQELCWKKNIKKKLA